MRGPIRGGLDDDEALLALAVLVGSFVAGLGDDGPYLFDQARKRRARPVDLSVAVVSISVIDLAIQLVWSEAVTASKSDLRSVDQLLDQIEMDAARLLRRDAIEVTSPPMSRESLSDRSSEALAFAGMALARQRAHDSARGA